MIDNFQFFSMMPLRQLSLGVLYCRFNNYLMFIAKEKLHFYLSVVFIAAYWKKIKHWKLRSNLPSEG